MLISTRLASASSLTHVDFRAGADALEIMELSDVIATRLSRGPVILLSTRTGAASTRCFRSRGQVRLSRIRDNP